jgi:hypothetical protein
MVGAKFVATRAMDRKALEQYLDQYHGKFTGLRAAMVEDAQMWDLLDSPLMLWVAALAFRNYDAKAGPQGGTTKKKLFELYLDQMLKRDRNRAQEEEEPEYYPEDAKRWLKQLAVAMQRAKVFSFQMEDLDLRWSKEQFQARSFFLLAGFLGLVGGLLGLVPAVLDETVPLWIPLAFDMGPGSGLDDWWHVLGTVDWRMYLLWSPLTGILSSVVLALAAHWLSTRLPRDEIEAIEESSDNSKAFSWAQMAVVLTIFLFLGWFGNWFAGWLHASYVRPFTETILIPAGAIGWGAWFGAFASILLLTARPEDERRWSWIVGLQAGVLGMALGAGFAFHLSWIYTLASALLWCLMSALSAGEQALLLANRSTVNSGFWLSLRLAITTFVGCAVLMLAIALAANSSVMAYYLIHIGAFGAFLLLLRGGAFCLRHIGVRATLAVQKVIPWRMERFLEFAVDHVFLVRQGGSFRFVHRLLQEHLAESEKA